MEEFLTSQESLQRSPAQVREHYEIEKELAARLMASERSERKVLYQTLYDELYRRVPHHPQLTRKVSQDAKAAYVRVIMKLIECSWRGGIFLEIGAGDCSISVEMSKTAKHVYAVDVSTEITKGALPDNCELVLSDGCSIPVPANSVNMAFSNQLMEHLHPDDAMEQLKHIYGAIVPGGIYMCVTPNKLTGPHDISRGFDEVSTGFHLKEYSISDLRDYFLSAGFSSVRCIIGARGRYTHVSSRTMRAVERLAARLPQFLIIRRPIETLLGSVIMVGQR